MIAVLADDFTGAAELAGISLAYFNKVQVGMQYVPEKSDAEVLIICSDSRSVPEKEAVQITAAILKKILPFHPFFIYKKTDSVLRGHVIAELKIQMEQSKLSKALLLPANPSLSRTILNGEYYIGKNKITETDFVHDPEFPVQSAKVQDMVHDDSVKAVAIGTTLPEKGIVIGDAVTIKDLEQWFAAVDKNWLYAGAGDFFRVMLQKSFQPIFHSKVELELPFLYVSGTAFAASKKYIRSLSRTTDYVAYLPDDANSEWLNKTCKIINSRQKLVLAIDTTNKTAVEKRLEMARVVKAIMEREYIKEIFIEGGSTAAGILDILKIKLLQPVYELERGVVRMRAGNLLITVKPGSYALPKQIAAIYR